MKNIRKTLNPITVVGIGGSLRVTQCGDFGSIKGVYYHPEAVANVLCFADLVEKYSVKFDNSVGDYFVVDTGKCIVRFLQIGKLYILNAHDTEAVSLTIKTVEGNSVSFTKRELKKAEMARDLYVKLCRPAEADFIRMIKMGKIEGCEITVKDVERAQLIYGKDIGAIMGRTTREKPQSVQVEPKTVSAVPKPVVVEGDLLEVEGNTFFITITRDLQLLMGVNVPQKDKYSLAKAVRMVAAAHEAKGFHVSSLLFDGEAGISAARAEIESLGIQLDLAPTGEHVPRIERANRQIKERVRAELAVMPFDVPALLVIHLIYYVISSINMVPRGDSEESPRERFSGERFNVQKHGRVRFGELCHVHEDRDITNGMEPRARAAIALGPAYNAQGSYKFLALDTWEVINRRSWTPGVYDDQTLAHINVKAAVDKATRQGKETPVVVETRQVPLAAMGIPAPAAPGGTPLENQALIEAILAEAADAIGPEADVAADPPEPQEVADPPQPVMQPVAQPPNLRQGVVTRRMVRDGEAKINVTLAGDEDDDDEDDSEMALSYDAVERILSAVSLYLVREPGEGVCLNTLSLKQGLKKHGQRAIVALVEEFSQLTDKNVLLPVDRREAVREPMQSIVLYKEKRDGRLKARAVANGKKQWWVSVRASSSPTVRTESVMISLVIDAFEGRTVVVVDIEGAYLAAEMTDEEYIETDRNLSSIILHIKPEWEQYLGDDGKFTFRLLKALYGCVQSARLFYEHLRKSLLDLGFAANPYDPCVFNATMHGVQVTATIHVDDLKISSVDPRGVDDTIAGLERVYKKLTIKRGLKFDYLGMEIDFSETGVVKVGSRKLAEQFVEGFEHVKRAKTPATADLFKVDPTSELLPSNKAEIFHSRTALALYKGKHGRPDILTVASFLSTRVQAPTVEDWRKLERLEGYMLETLDLVLTLGAKSLNKMEQGTDASYGVHVDGKSHTGILVSLGRGAIFGKSVKQKVVSQSSCEAELVALADGANIARWFRLFMGAQGHKMLPTDIRQDNQSTILIAETGVPSQRTRHVDIRYFAVKEQIDKGQVRLVETRTEEMGADYFTKGLTGSPFLKHRMEIMGERTGTAEGVCCAEDAGHAKSAVPVITGGVRDKKGSNRGLIPNDRRTVKPGLKM